MRGDRAENNMRFATKLSMGAAFASAVALLAPAGARAQLIETTSISPAGDMNWSATAGRTVGANNSALHVEAGWPGIGFTYLKGLNERTDLGFHVGFNYGFEGTSNTAAGLNLAVPFRRTLGVAGDATIAFRTDPGISFYGNQGSLLFGVGGPVGVVAGVKPDPRLTLDVGADLPVLISFANPAGLLFGPQLGAGAEYLIDRDVAVTFRARVGPAFALASSGSGSAMGFQALVGVAYNTR
jgi:hypothetical protein